MHDWREESIWAGTDQHRISPVAESKRLGFDRCRLYCRGPKNETVIATLEVGYRDLPLNEQDALRPQTVPRDGVFQADGLKILSGPGAKVYIKTRFPWRGLPGEKILEEDAQVVTPVE